MRSRHSSIIENQGAMCESHTPPSEADTYNNPIVVQDMVAVLMDAYTKHFDDNGIAIYTMLIFKTAVQPLPDIFIWTFIVSHGDRRHISGDEVRKLMPKKWLQQSVMARLQERETMNHAWLTEHKFFEIYKPGHISHLFSETCPAIAKQRIV